MTRRSSTGTAPVGSGVAAGAPLRRRPASRGRLHAAIVATWASLAGFALPATAAAPDTAASAPAAKRHATPHAAVPAANFLVEWRLQPADATPVHGDVVITSGSATIGGATGYGPGAIVVGTARAAVPQAVRVANGKEGSIQFDHAETHLVYDTSYAASSSSRSATGAASGNAGSGASRSRSQSEERGASGHDVVVHHVDGLRVTPHWTQGDTLELDVALTHAAPASGSGHSTADSRASRDIDFHSIVQVSFDEWQSVASIGDGGEELQVRVRWR